MLKQFRSIRRLFSNVKFTESHEWVIYSPETKSAKVGITNFAKEQLGQIVHVEFPKVGKQFKKGEEAITIQSVKVSASIYSPVNGTLKANNTQPEKDINIFEQVPAEDLWLMEINCEKEPTGLLTREQYDKKIKEGA